MRWGICFVVGMAAGAAVICAVLSFHVVWSQSGFCCVEKKQLAFELTFVDIRDWTLSDWKKDPAVAEALIRGGRPDLVVNPSATDQLRDAVSRITLTQSQSAVDSFEGRL